MKSIASVPLRGHNCFTMDLMPAAAPSRVTRITSILPVVLLLSALCFQVICIDAFEHDALDQRTGRQIKATMLISAPLNRTGGGPPVNHTIYSDQLEPGWAVFANGSGLARHQQVIGGVSSGSNAFCATLPDASVSLTCAPRTS